MSKKGDSVNAQISKTEKMNGKVLIKEIIIVCGWTTAIATLSLAGCAGGGSRGGAEGVRVVTAEQLQGCTNVGSAHVTVVDNLPRLQQIEGAVAGELIALAGNSARQLGGNAIIEMTNIVDGGQSFAVFRCP